MRRKGIVIICAVLILAAFFSWQQFRKGRVASRQLAFYKEAIFRDNSEIKHTQYLGRGFHLVETAVGKVYLIRMQDESRNKGIIEGYELKNRIVEYR
ncbi:MAG TPA: hypothetical protein GX699_03250 [Firmicutes bacterium]|nr:hypothetical protein [Bacillota bacterium]